MVREGLSSEILHYELKINFLPSTTPAMCPDQVNFSTDAPQSSVGSNLMPIEEPTNSRAPRASYGPLVVASAIYLTPKRNSFVYVYPPPTTSELLSTIEAYGLPKKIYRDPFYSNPGDVPYRPREYAGLVYHLKGDANRLSTLEGWQTNTLDPLSTGDKPRIISPGGWEFSGCPPSRRRIKVWLKDNPPTVGKRAKMRSQVSFSRNCLYAILDLFYSLDRRAHSRKLIWAEISSS